MISFLPNNSPGNVFSNQQDDLMKDSWVPDGPMCLLCQDSFSVFNRRHHCRNCGTLVCNPCSSHRAQAIGYGKLVRVCDPCFAKLGKLARGSDPRFPKLGDRGVAHGEPEERKGEDNVSAVESNANDGNGGSPDVEVPAAAAAAAAVEDDDDGGAIPDLEPIEEVLALDLFNRLSGGWGALVVLDTRPKEQFQAGHVPRAINVPITLDDVRGQVDLAALEAKCSMADKRTFKRRQRAKVVICAQSGPGGDGSQNEVEESESKEVIAGSMHAPQVKYLGQLLRAERRVMSVHAVTGGWAAFNATYPFLSCEYKPREVKSGRHNHKPPFPWYPNEVLGNFMYLGNHVDAKNKAHLKHLGITHILNVSSDVDNFHEDDFKYLRFVLDDNEEADIAQHFNEGFAFLDDARAESNARVLVHCHQGVSRSATVVIAYIMKNRDWTLKKAYDFVKAHRKQAFPNVGFWQQLEQFEKSLHGGVSTLSECIDLDMLLQEVANKKAGLNPDGSSD